MPKDINFHKVNDIATDSITKIDGNMNMYFQRDGRIFLDDLTGTPVEMSPHAESGKFGMVKTTKLLSDISSTSESLVPTVSLLKVVYDEIMTPDRDTTFGGKVIINANKGLLFPETTQKTIPHGMNGMIGGPGQSDAQNASTNIYSQDKVIFSPSEEGGAIAPGSPAVTINVMTGDLSVARQLYVGGKKVLTDGFAVRPEDIGAAPVQHRHPWSQIDGIPYAGESVAGVVKMTSSTGTWNHQLAASAHAVAEVKNLADSKMPLTGGYFTGWIAFNMAREDKIWLTGDDFIGYNNSINTMYLRADNGNSRSTIQANINHSLDYAMINGKKLFIQGGTPSGASAGDVWIQV